jgi:hypothetical protein
MFGLKFMKIESALIFLKSTKPLVIYLRLFIVLKNCKMNKGRQHLNNDNKAQLYHERSQDPGSPSKRNQLALVFESHQI